MSSSCLDCGSRLRLHERLLVHVIRLAIAASALLVVAMTCSTGVGFKHFAAKEKEESATVQPPDNTTLVVGDDAPPQAAGGDKVPVGNGPAPASGGGYETKSAGSYIKLSVFVLFAAVLILV